MSTLSPARSTFSQNTKFPLRKKPWAVQYKKLAQFRIRNPHAWPTAAEDFPRHKKLREWCNTQKKAYKAGEMPQERIDLLNQIGFCWAKWETKPWTSQYETLIQFRSQNPGRWPKSKEEFPAGNKLGDWCHTQRKNNRTKSLSLERIYLLNMIEFPWKQI